MNKPNIVEFYESPRSLTAGPPFIGARLLDAAGSVCSRELCGIGYTKHQALDDLKETVQAKGSFAFQFLALPCIETAAKATPAEPVSQQQDWVHQFATAAYQTSRVRTHRRPRKGGGG